MVSVDVSTETTYFGGPSDNLISAGDYSNWNGYLNLDCAIASKLVSAVVYAEITNTITFELRDNIGLVLDDTTINVQAGAQRLYFDFDIPSGSGFQLGVSSGNTRLYRNNAGNGNNVGYPFNIGPVTINGANNNNSTQYYYFYYDLEITTSPSIPCWNSPGGSLEVINPDPTFSYTWYETSNLGVDIGTGSQINNLYAGDYIVMAHYLVNNLSLIHISEPTRPY